MIRSILTVLVGLIAGSVTVFALEWVGHRIQPPPAGLDLQNMEALKAYVSTAPPVVFVLLLAAWAGGGFVGGLVAAMLAARKRVAHALAVGSIQTILAVVQLVMIPHPIWVAVVGVLCFVPFAWFSGRLVGDPLPTPTV